MSFCITCLPYSNQEKLPWQPSEGVFFVVVVLTLVSAFDKFIYLFILACLLNSEDHTIGLSLLTKTNILLKS